MDTGYAQYMTAFNRNFGSSSEMWEKGRSKDSDFPPGCLCRSCVWEENTV